jgi:hypothetical protein
MGKGKDSAGCTMPQPFTSMDIFKDLPRTNCKQCGVPSCLAFSVQVFKGEKQLDDCPFVEKDFIAKVTEKIKQPKTTEQNMDEALEKLKRKIATVDLSSAAQRLGAPYANGRLTIHVLGKDFTVDTNGLITTNLHVNPWITIPVLSYIIKGAGIDVSGEWVPFRDLEGGKTWYRLFGQRCEKPLKEVADNYTGLFKDMLHVFNGKQVENHYSSDISLVLQPLPKVPMLICYWTPDPADGFESDLNLFFDATADRNLPIGALYTLGVGLVTMFQKIALRHR